MKNKNGFTLIEILAVIIIIGIVALIAIPSVTGYLNSAKDTTYETYEKSMIDATKNRIIDCVSESGDCELPEGNQSLKVTLDSLIENGYIDNMKDPESNGFCDQTLSYVSIRGKEVSDYTYKACLFCGDYSTDDDDCHRANGDNDLPECGLVTGESSRWTNENRTISVLCSDKTSGCERSAFSKTFTTTTNSIEGKPGVATITITDNSGRTNKCEVNAFVDKTLPTCNIDVEGDYINSVGWYSLEALAILKNIKDDDSGILTYGMGTSVKNKEYNKITQMTFNKGITTVVGYVKDIAGNDNICAQEIRVGTEIPKFNLYYGYQIYPDKEPYLLNDITENGTILTTKSENPRITINNLSKYKGVEKIRITLNNDIPVNTTATIRMGNVVKTAPMVKNAREILFIVPNGNYGSLEITLGEYSDKVYTINKIELYAKDGSTWTNKDITLYVEPVDAGMPTTQVSFLNGQNGSWTNIYNKVYSSVTSNKIITKNGINMQSVPVDYTTRVDKVMPIVNMTAKKATSNTVVTDGTYSNEGLKYLFKIDNVGQSGAKIYYCKDTTNTCEPNIEVANNTEVTDFTSITTNYYIRYRMVSNSYGDGDINVFNAKFDLVKPVCTFQNISTITIDRETDIELTCTDGLSGIVVKDLAVSNFTKSNDNLNIISVSKSEITGGVKYALKVKGVTQGNVTLSLNANSINDKAGNVNDTASLSNLKVNGIFTITLNNQSATNAGTATIYESYKIGWYSNNAATTAISSITIPNRNGYIFDGYYTNTNGGGTNIINAKGTFTSNSYSFFLDDTTIYAKWNACGNGSYCANNARTSCPIGTFGNGTATASTQAEACSVCPGGTYGNGNIGGGSQSASCSACEAGYACSGGTNRVACGPGLYSQGGWSSCRSCTVGTYSTGSANSSCSGCPSGQSSASGSSGCFATVTNYGYTGGIQSFTAPATGNYLLEVWGAQGGADAEYYGGYGGYSRGNVHIAKGTVIYIVVGGQGASSAACASGGYNGGGRAGCDGSSGGGGGATHMGTESKLLKDSAKANLYLVAGGGGGAGHLDSSGGPGATGGGTNGGTVSGGGGTQSSGGSGNAGGSYGVGGTRNGDGGAGGGGLYGGGAATNDYGGGGGSGYIGNVTAGATYNGYQSGNGYARVTWQGE